MGETAKAVSASPVLIRETWFSETTDDVEIEAIMLFKTFSNAASVEFCFVVGVVISFITVKTDT